jgi:DNA phosphorothioation-associated DGQHR protein 1
MRQLVEMRALRNCRAILATTSLEDMPVNFPYQVPALRVEQPLGLFYVAILPARLLLDVAYSDVLSASMVLDKDAYELDGTQRIVSQTRLTQIAEYINRADAAFPNSIIIAANFRREDGLIEDAPDDEDAVVDEPVAGAKQKGEVAKTKPIDRRWDVVEEEDGCFRLTIPTRDKLAAIIDGQHRLFGFALANPERLDMSLMCSIYLDLPKPYQAQLFATINSTQKRVDKSLTYELFGYNVEQEAEELWTPDKVAVFLSRRLATDAQSPLKGRIVIAPKKDAALTKLAANAAWRVSTAVVVEGIMRLFTSNPKRDTALMLEKSRKKRRELATLRNDRSPLRRLYLESQDAVIYKMVSNYLLACEKVFWSNTANESFITKTVGVQALFDILRSFAGESYEVKNISSAYFEKKLTPAAEIDFASAEFRNASGSGRSAIRRAIADAIG